MNFSDGKTARVYAAQSARPDLTDSAYPYPTVSIGEEGGNPAYVRLVNAYTHRRYEALSLSAVQIERNLIVRNGSTFDLGAETNILCVGQGTVGGLITNSIAGGTVDFDQAQDSYIRVNGDQKTAFEALIAAGRIVNTGGLPPRAIYSVGDAHTVVDAPSGGILILIR